MCGLFSHDSRRKSKTTIHSRTRTVPARLWLPGKLTLGLDLLQFLIMLPQHSGIEGEWGVSHFPKEMPFVDISKNSASIVDRDTKDI